MYLLIIFLLNILVFELLKQQMQPKDAAFE